ncbi:transporter substrate-binding domain-containing protein [Cupriavidus sp. SW-Y-13]|nr:transporter substrate-binding domain-containing protein [Cupriavidus sp. SW-Y-13]
MRSDAESAIRKAGYLGMRKIREYPARQRSISGPACRYWGIGVHAATVSISPFLALPAPKTIDGTDAMDIARLCRTLSAAALLAVATLGTAPPASAQTRVVLYSEAGQRPLSYEENGAPKGDYIDHFMRVANRIPGYQVEIRFASWARTVEEAKNGNSAGILGVYYRPKERPYLNHSKAFYAEEVAVHCNRDAIEGRTFHHYPDDFAGLRFGNQRNYLAPGPRFFQMVKEGRITMVEGHEFQDLVKKMLVGEIDCVVNPSIVIKEALRSLETRGLPERMRYKSRRALVIKTETVHIGFSKKYEEAHPELAKFRQLFNQAAPE